MNKIEAVERDLRESQAHIEKAHAIIEKLLPGWRVTAVEGQNNEVCKMLDISCGIDYLLSSEKTSCVYGLASRVQYGKNYRTFTVRHERASGSMTEYAKRLKAEKFGGLSPSYTMQMYVLDGKIQGLGITKTADILEFVSNGFAEENVTGASKIGQAKFYVCRWDAMKSAGYSVIEYKK